MYPSPYNEPTSQHNNTRQYSSHRSTKSEQNSLSSEQNWDVCWNYLSLTGCKRGDMCRWRHIDYNSVESMNNIETEPKLMAEGVIINILNDDNIDNELEIQLILYNIICYQTVLIDNLITYTKLKKNKILNSLKILCLLGFIDFNSNNDQYEICSKYLSKNLYHSKDPLIIELQHKFGDFYFGQFKPFQLYMDSATVNSNESVTETVTVNSNNYNIENNSNSAVSCSNNNSSFDLSYAKEETKDKYEIADRLIKQQKIKKILSFAKRRHKKINYV